MARREYQISKILSGKQHLRINGQDYTLHNPTPYEKYLIGQYYEERLNDFEFEPVFRKNNILDVLVALDIVPKDIDDKLFKMDRDIEALKHKLYLNHSDPAKRKSYKNTLKNLRQMYNSMFQSRHMLDHLTLEGYAESSKIYRLFSFCLKCNDQPCNDPVIIERAIMKANTDKLGHEDFRELSRTDPWRSIWSAASDKLFGSDISDDQCVLVMYTKMYDSAYKSNDPPDNYIIEDDDLFDGWLIEQRKQIDKERAKSKNKNHMGGINADKADEVYFLKDKTDKRTTEEFIKDVNSMNSLEANIAKEQRKAALEKHGKLKETELPDIKRDLQMQAQQKLIERFKKKG